MGSFSLLQGIVPTQGSNPGIVSRIAGGFFYQLSHKGSPCNVIAAHNLGFASCKFIYLKITAILTAHKTSENLTTALTTQLQHITGHIPLADLALLWGHRRCSINGLTQDRATRKARKPLYQCSYNM